VIRKEVVETKQLKTCMWSSLGCGIKLKRGLCCCLFLLWVFGFTTFSSLNTYALEFKEKKKKINIKIQTRTTSRECEL
jgi:hypothetical protein